jgi:hypothetical protein
MYLLKLWSQLMFKFICRTDLGKKTSAFVAVRHHASVDGEYSTVQTCANEIMI